MKSIFSSKTFWFAVAKFVLGAITAFSTAFGSMIPASVAGVLLMVTSLIDAYLRSVTSVPVAVTDTSFSLEK